MIPVFKPQDEAELALAIGALEAHGIPYFVHNAGFGGLYPGLQIDLYNARTIMVDEDDAPRARDVLDQFLPEDTPDDEDESPELPRSVWGERLRLLAEFCLGGWCVPRRSRRHLPHDAR